MSEAVPNLQPNQRCDILMKGGITSGVVYPLAICALSKTYRFMNIGGTSAGAIAAALAAAAEYRRATGSLDGFEELAKLPDELGDGTLLKLFSPQRKTRSLYKLALAFVGSSPAYLKVSKALLMLYLHFPIGVVLGFLPGFIILSITFSYLRHSLPIWLWVALLFFLIVLPSFLVALLNFLIRAIWAIPTNYYGLCGGLSVDGKSPALTDWMADKIESIAGDADRKSPLTFNDLWKAGRNNSAPTPDHPEQEINLQMMTTNLTFGRPYRLPFTPDEEHLFYFSPKEFRDLFPKDIVDHMEQNPPRGRRDEKYWPLMQPEYLPFPDPGDLPIVVATRMSLSFPVLISAIPLHTVDWSTAENQRALDHGTRPKLDRCWFSDGGISSNFPIHFFDSPIPRWPTFAIYLNYIQPSENLDSDECNNVHLSRCNRPNQNESWNRFGDKQWRLAGFLGAILNTMENWMDQTQARVPGYRDRIATVDLAPDEGGINLNMPKEIIERLSKRGECAGEALQRRFDPNLGDKTGLNWENQRWIRYRSFMSVAERTLAQFKLAFNYNSPGVRSYSDMIKAGGPNSNELSQRCGKDDGCPFDGPIVCEVDQKTNAFIDLARKWEQSVNGNGYRTFERGSPQPPSELRIRPRV